MTKDLFVSKFRCDEGLFFPSCVRYFLKYANEIHLAREFCVRCRSEWLSVRADTVGWSNSNFVFSSGSSWISRRLREKRAGPRYRRCNFIFLRYDDMEVSRVRISRCIEWQYSATIYGRLYTSELCVFRDLIPLSRDGNRTDCKRYHAIETEKSSLLFR